MMRTLPLLLITVLAACAQRTTQEDMDLNNFVEARQRAAIYYDGGDYIRATAQYRKALEYRPLHDACRLGYAYSLLGTDVPRHLLTAREQFGGPTAKGRDPAPYTLRRLSDERLEVKRIYGLGMTNRGLATHFQRRSNKNRENGRLNQEIEDQKWARLYAKAALVLFNKVLAIDQALADRKIVGSSRVSASLKPLAHIAMAHCEIILGGPNNTEPYLRADEHIKSYAAIAANARKFWKKRRARRMVIDPLRERASGAAAPGRMTNEESLRYDRRIANTVQREVAARSQLLYSYHNLNKYRKAIEEATLILELDNTMDEAVFLRARAYSMLRPPNYKAALSDMKEYRSRQDLGQLTERLVHINQHIKRLEAQIAEEAVR